MLPLMEHLYITGGDHSFEADAFFPAICPDDWRELERHEHAIDDKHAYRFSFVDYQRA